MTLDAPSRGLVLVVEDNDGMREAISDLLEVAGFAHVMFAAAQKMLAYSPVEDVLCVISDINLPDMSGFELLARLHKLGKAPSVILISANDTSAIRCEAKRCGATAFLAKPFAGIALVGEIERIAAAIRFRAATGGS